MRNSNDKVQLTRTNPTTQPTITNHPNSAALNLTTTTPVSFEGLCLIALRYGGSDATSITAQPRPCDQILLGIVTMKKLSTGYTEKLSVWFTTGKCKTAFNYLRRMLQNLLAATVGGVSLDLFPKIVN